MSGKRTVILVGGANGAGKTTLIRKLIAADERVAGHLALEIGEERVESPGLELGQRTRRKGGWEESVRGFARDLEVLYVEMNAQEMPAQAVRVLEKAGIEYRIETVLFVQDADSTDILSTELGPTLLAQLREADCAVVPRSLEPDAKKEKRLRRRLRSAGLRGELVFCGEEETREEREELFEALVRPPSAGRDTLLFPFSLAGVAILAVWALVLQSQTGNDMLMIFLGILLQALPFLIIGVILSAAIEVYFTRRRIERLFGTGGIRSLLSSVLLGFILPVCDCASVPVFRALTQKGVPLAHAVIFLLVAPVINPVALSSTIFAFGFGPVVLLRIGMSIAVAVIVGLSVGRVETRSVWRTDRLPRGAGSEVKRPFLRFAEAGWNEFRSVFAYLVIGSAVCAVLQIALRESGFHPAAASGGEAVLAILVMMFLAFALSLCSSSDAIVARSIAPFVPGSSVMAFLVYGPMIDLKNLLLLSGTFKKRFIAQIAVMTTVLVYIASMVLQIGGVL